MKKEGKKERKKESKKERKKEKMMRLTWIGMGMAFQQFPGPFSSCCHGELDDPRRNGQDRESEEILNDTVIGCNLNMYTE